MKPLAILILFFQSLLCFAETVVVKDPIINGPGCPQGSVQASLAPDGSAISILFDQFSVQVAPGRYNMNDPQLTRICRFKIPIEIPEGFNVETTELQYRGFAQIPSNSYGRLTTTGPAVKMRRGGNYGDSIKQEFGQMSDGFFITQKVDQSFQGRCQNQKFLEFTTQINVWGPMSRAFTLINESILMTLDSVDMGDSAIELGIRATRCR